LDGDVAVDERRLLRQCSALRSDALSVHRPVLSSEVYDDEQIIFETSERLSPNGRLELTISLPGSLREVKLIGRVKHMRSKYEEVDGKKLRMYGYGIQFEEVPSAEGKVLQRFFKRAIADGARETPQS